MAEKKKILYIVEAMGGGVFTYIVDLANELVNKYDMYIAYAVRKQTPKNYKDYFDKRIHLIEVKNFRRAIDPMKDIAAFFEVKKIAAEIKPDIIHLHSSKAGAIGRMAFNGKIPMFYTPHGYSFLMENYKPMKRRMFKLIESVCAKRNCTTISCSVGEHIQVSKLKLMRANHTSQIYSLESDIARRYPAEITAAKERIAGLKADLAVAKPLLEQDKEKFSITVEDRVYTDRKEAGSAILAACAAMKIAKTEGQIANLGGFAISSRFDAFAQTFKLTIKRQSSYTIELGSDPAGNIQRILNALASIEKTLPQVERRLETLQQQLAEAKEEVQRPFPQEAELNEKSARLAELNALLDMDEKGDDAALGMDEEVPDSELPAPKREIERSADSVKRPSIKSIGFSLEDGSIYSGMFDLMVGGEVQAEVVNHIQHYRESPLVQKAISDMKTLLEKRQASKELEERPNTRQSVREALKNRKKAQEQQSNQEQAKPKKAKKKGEMER